MRMTNFIRRHIFIRMALCLSLLASISQDAMATVWGEEYPMSLMEGAWREFRRQHPYGLQTVALSHRGDTCVFVISEPPPTIDAMQLGALFADRGGHMMVCTHTFGLDGCLRDAVGCVRLDSTDFGDFEKGLFGLLYGTDYKPYYTDLDKPSRQVCFSPVNLNIRTGSMDWEEWSGKARFVDSQGQVLTIKEILATGSDCTEELMFSQKHGFVAWRIGTRTLLGGEASFRINARHFALDTDLVLHSYSNDSCLVVVGRERKVPVTILPPLRSETLCQLAGSAGSTVSLYLNSEKAEYFGEEDVWITPVVSDAILRDTELGNLMLLCDIILKSWSENGQAKESFIGYPMPAASMPGHGVKQELGHPSYYQWAANPIMTGSPMPVYQVLGRRRALETARMSAAWQEYFAGQNCVELVRLAQYMMLSQAFASLDAGPGQTGKRDAWVETPTYTVSTARWVQGGCNIGRGPQPLISQQGPLRAVSRAGKVALSGTARLGRSFYQVPRISLPSKVAVPLVPGAISPLPPILTSTLPATGLFPSAILLPVMPAMPPIPLPFHLAQPSLPGLIPNVTGLQLEPQQRGFVPGLHDMYPTLQKESQQPEKEGHSLQKVQDELRAKLLRLKGRMDLEAVRNDIIIIALIKSDHHNRTYAYES